MKSLTSSLSNHSPRDRHRRSTRKLLVAEISIKLLVNCLLIATGLSTLVKLVPSYVSQLAKLHEIKLMVNQTQNRVDRLGTKFNANFDPKRTQTIVEEQTPLIRRGQVPVFWLDENYTSQD